MVGKSLVLQMHTTTLLTPLKSRCTHARSDQNCLQLLLQSAEHTYKTGGLLDSYVQYARPATDHTQESRMYTQNKEVQCSIAGTGTCARATSQSLSWHAALQQCCRYPCLLCTKLCIVKLLLSTPTPVQSRFCTQQLFAYHTSPIASTHVHMQHTASC
jgi:hypothetical protein